VRSQFSSRILKRGIALGSALGGFAGLCWAATFGTVVQIRGVVSDIALDQRRNAVYAANFTANRIEVVSMKNYSLSAPIIVAQQPSTLALSPDGRYLVVGHYHFPDQPVNHQPPQPSCDPEDSGFQVLTVIDLANSARQTRVNPGGACVLAVAFGNSPRALVVSTDGVRLFDPASGQLQPLNLTNFGSMPLPVPWATFPPQILKASAGVSGDGNIIYALVDAAGASWLPLHAYPLGYELVDDQGHIQQVIVAGVSGPALTAWNDTGGTTTDGGVTWQDTGMASSVVIRYDTVAGNLTLLGTTPWPPLGPRVISVDGADSTFMAGWTLFCTPLAEHPVEPCKSHPTVPLVDMANFPYPPGVYNQGSAAFDWSRKLIYAQVTPGTIQATLGSPAAPAPATNAPLLHLVDSDNLTVEEVFQLRENLAGKSLLTSDFQTMYSISDSGLTVFPIGHLANLHRAKAVPHGANASQAGSQMDVLFKAGACDQGVMKQFVDIVDPGGGRTDFQITPGTPGISVSPASGTTPQTVEIDVDISAFQSRKGTTVVPFQVTAVQGVDVPNPGRLLINMRDPDQQGTIHDVPGTIVDVLADPARNRLYVIQQDRNAVQAFDGTTFQPIGAIRTGNTPVQMAITRDNRYLLVTNDNSQFISVADLDTLQLSTPILFPQGYFPRSIAVSSNKILATSRGAPPAPWPGAALVHVIDFPNRMAGPPEALGIYANNPGDQAVLAASPVTANIIFMPMPDGTVAEYEAQSDTCSPALVGCGFVASRHDLSALSGAYAALNDNLFVADVNVLNEALVPIGQIAEAGASSGVSVANGSGLFLWAPSGSTTGSIARFDMSQFTAAGAVRTAESPFVASAVKTTPTPLFQIGQTILPFTRTLAPLPNGQSIVLLSTSGFTVLPWDFDAAASTPPVVTAVNSAADGSLPIAPGGLISIYGHNLSSSSQGAVQTPLPTTLGGTCLAVNSEPLPLLYVSSTQINAQLPFDATGGGWLVARSPGGVSNGFPLEVVAAAPSVFRSGTAGPVEGLATVFRSSGENYSLVTLSNPIHPKDTLVIYATGMGATSPLPESGDAAPAEPLAYATEQPIITIGNMPLEVMYAGLAPGEVGVYQLNAAVPFWISGGLQLPLTISQGGQSTTVKVRVVTP